MSIRNETAVEIVLASGSRSRRTMLENAGIEFSVLPADVDEAAIREAFTGGSDGGADPADIAQVLAIAKAERVSRSKPGALVIGSDQVMAMDGRIFDKPTDMDDARQRLLDMRGKVHQLHAAVAIAIDGAASWSMTDTAQMGVRDYSPAFIGAYLAEAGTRVLSSVGAYQLEGLGVQLFEDIRGDFFTILGMPLLPLLGELRSRGVVRT